MAQAKLYLTQSQAASGDTVNFSISDTNAGDAYVLKIGDNDVASGNDDDGGGVSDTFKMPDLGNSGRTVSVEAHISGSTGEHIYSRTIDYIVPTSGTSGPTGATQPQTSPSKTPAPAITPIHKPPHRVPATNTTPKTTKPKIKTTAPTTTATPQTFATTPATTHTPHTKARHVRATTRHVKPLSSHAGASASPPKTSFKAPSKSAPTAIGAISGAADISSGGFPSGLIVLLLLFALAGVAAFAFRLSRDLGWGLPRGKAADEARLTALSRAASANAEWQRAIAQRRASRAGRAG